MLIRPAGTAFVAIGSGTSKAPDLLGALDQIVSSGNDELPLKFAEKMLEKAASATKSVSFLQASASTAPAAESYSSASNGIFGIMNQMLDEFKADLASSKTDEAKAVEDFKALKASKE